MSYFWLLMIPYTKIILHKGFVGSSANHQKLPPVKRAVAMSVMAKLDCSMVTVDLRNKRQPISGMDLLIISLSFD